MRSLTRRSLLLLLSCSVSGKGLWASTPAPYSNFIQGAYPVGNGKLGAMPFGPAGADKVNLNVDSLWSGGPFTSSSYTGGNPTTAVYPALPGIREWIFENAVGNVSQLLGSQQDYYGSYLVLGNLSVIVDGISKVTSYNRSLDLDTGVHTTTYIGSDDNSYTTSIYCTYPDQVCIYSLSSSAALPQITISLENQLTDPLLVNRTCGENFVRLTGVTQLGPPLGQKYETIARLTTRTGTATCSITDYGTLVIPAGSHIRTFSLAIGAATNYDQKKGNAASGFSFKGDDPGPYVETVTAAAAAKSETDLRGAHIADYQQLAHAFSLEVPDTAHSAGLETSEIISRYNYTSAGDPYLESLLFSYGRHLFISSQRDNSLPGGLQGRWTQLLDATPWGGDYHANINFQMNHWGMDETGLGALMAATWNFIEDTWVPRGTETARLLYNASTGWVAHDEMNIYGHTGMKYEAQWANYPASNAWMMQHVWDHYEYSQDEAWLKTQGYPLIKGVAQFWLSQLQPDGYFKDGSLVVNPCNSPEHGPTTFGCNHYHQLVHQVFEATIAGSSIVGEIDAAYVNEIKKALIVLDKGLHIGSWGEIKEWKMPDSLGYDFMNDTHRHLSQLNGWYPGYSISSFASGYSSPTTQSAISTSLFSRGLGSGSDANSGWEKVWRSACWARLNNTAMAYEELKYAIDVNFAGNGLSMYWALSPLFQIDANAGLVGAILAMLVVDLPVVGDGVRTVILGPAIPWKAGKVKGLRLRGGGKVDFEWDDTGLVKGAHMTGRVKPLTVVDKNGKVLTKQA